MKLKRFFAATVAAVMCICSVQLPASAEKEEKQLFESLDFGIKCDSFDDFKTCIRLYETGALNYYCYEDLEAWFMEGRDYIYVPKALKDTSPDHLWFCNWIASPEYREEDLKCDLYNFYSGSGEKYYADAVKAYEDDKSAKTGNWARYKYRGKQIYIKKIGSAGEKGYREYDYYFERDGRYFELRVYDPAKKPKDHLYLCETEKVPLYDGEFPPIKDVTVPYKNVGWSEFTAQEGYCIRIDGKIYSCYTSGLDLSDPDYESEAKRMKAEGIYDYYTFPSYEEFKKLSPVGIYKVDEKLSYNVYVTDGNVAILEKIGGKNLFVLLRVEPEHLYKNQWAWTRDAAGNSYRYYVDSTGAAVTGLFYDPLNNGLVQYSDNGGQYKGKYTGWADSLLGRSYFKNGYRICSKWLSTKSGKKYYFDYNGFMRTGWAMTSRSKKGKYSYFDENGVWDGKIYTSGYKVRDLGTVYTDTLYWFGNDFQWAFNDHSDKSMKAIGNSDEFEEELADMLRKDVNKPLIWDSDADSGTIYHGGKKIVIRNKKCPDLDFEFTKDKKGDSYLYNADLGFGLKLSDKDAYDKLLKLVK